MNPDQLKIVLILEEGFLFSSEWIPKMIHSLRHHQIIQVIQTDSNRNHSLAKVLLKNWKALGPLSLLRLISIAVKNRAFAKANLFGRRTLKRISTDERLPYTFAEHLNSDSTQKLLINLQPDVLICSLNTRVHKKILGTARYGAVNRHASILPSFAGLMPVFQAVAHGETRVGVSIHKMDEQLDCGPILIQKSFAISQFNSVWELYENCYKLSPEMITHSLEILLERTPPLLENEGVKPSYFSTPSKEDFELFKTRKYRFI